jgi:hypothetical protein
VFLLPEDQQPNKAFFQYWAGGVQIKQGSLTGKRVAGFSAEAQELGKVKFGEDAADLEIQVFRFPGAGAAGDSQREVVLAGPWAPIFLLHDGQRKDKANAAITHAWTVDDRQADGNVRYLKLTVDSEGAESKRTILLGVRLANPLPKTGDWAKPSDFTQARPATQPGAQ